MEEAAFMDEAIFYEVIVPLLENAGTSLICISTLLDSYNFFTDMCKAKRTDGQTFFDVIAVERICDNCKRLPLIEQRTNCTHKEMNVPMWKDRARLDLIRNSFYKDKPTLLSRETFGVISEDRNRVFAEPLLKAFEERLPIGDCEGKPACLFITVDPNELGNSHVSITTVYLKNGKIVIAGLESYPVKDSSAMTALVLSHIRGLRAIPRFRDITIFFIPESNLATAASIMATEIKRSQENDPLLGDVHIMYLDPNKPGVPGIPTHLQKGDYVEYLQTDLHLHCIYFDTEMISVNPILRTTQAMTEYRANIKKSLFIQLRGFRVIMGHDSAFRNTKPSYTGKVDENGKHLPGLKDDMVISLIMASFWSKKITSKPSFYGVSFNDIIRQ